MHIRPVHVKTDSEHIAAIITRFESTPVTASQFQTWCEHQPAGQMAHRIAAVDSLDRLMGYGYAIHEPWDLKGHFRVWAGVDRPCRGQGIGSALFEDALGYASQHEAKRLRTEIRDDDPGSLQFAQRRGFSLDHHVFESVLDLTTFDESRFTEVEQQVLSSGIHIQSLEEFEDVAAARRKLYDINYVAVVDTPGSEGVWMSYEEFERRVFGADWFSQEGQFVALDGEDFIGMAAVSLIPEREESYNLITGVLKPYRGRHIALALKLAVIRYARAHGANRIRTNNKSINAPMLAINEKLGYVREPGFYVLRREMGKG